MNLSGRNLPRSRTAERTANSRLCFSIVNPTISIDCFSRENSYFSSTLSSTKQPLWNLTVRERYSTYLYRMQNLFSLCTFRLYVGELTGSYLVQIVVVVHWFEMQLLPVLVRSAGQQVVENVVIPLVPPLRTDPGLFQKVFLHHSTEETI